jgi:hypothetical protein
VKDTMKAGLTTGFLKGGLYPKQRFVDVKRGLTEDIIGGRRLVRLPSSHTTVRAVRHTAIRRYFESPGFTDSGSCLGSPA